MNFSYLNNQVYPGHHVPLKPKVSVCLITYAHANYLETCLQNILNQKVNFDYEIIIGDDCSPDRTAEIVKKYAEQFPEKIKAFIRPQNAGAKINFLHCFFECQGEYIVHIEGDDYWTDPQKLQTQVDFLDANPNASACFHNAEIIFEDGSGFAPQLINKPDQKKWVSSQDFLGKKETWFMATASVMMRARFQPVGDNLQRCLLRGIRVGRRRHSAVNETTPTHERRQDVASVLLLLRRQGGRR